MPLAAVWVFGIDGPFLVVERGRHRAISVYVMKTDAADMTTIATDQRLHSLAGAIDRSKPAGLPDNWEAIPYAAFVRKPRDG